MVSFCYDLAMNREDSQTEKDVGTHDRSASVKLATELSAIRADVEQNEARRIKVDLADGYTPEESAELISSSQAALEAIGQYLGVSAEDLFPGLQIKISDTVDGGGLAVAGDNTIYMHGRRMLLSIDQMREVSGAWDAHELTEFPDTASPGGAMRYNLVHEVGHILDEQTLSGRPGHRIVASESPTRYGREPDQYNSEKDHEAFAEGFAHMIYGMEVSEPMAAAVQQTIAARQSELASKT